MAQPELEAWLREEVQRQVTRSRWRDGRILGGVALGLALSIPLGGLAIPARKAFEAGDRILAADINQNFENLWTAVTGLEDASLTRDAADDRYAAKGIAPVADGYFDPLNAEDVSIDVPSSVFTTVQTQSIDVPGPGRVIVIASATLESSGSTGIWVGVGGDGESDNAPSTYASLTNGAAQSLTVHGVFRVPTAGVKEFETTVLSPGVASVCRSSHMTLLFVPD